MIVPVLLELKSLRHIVPAMEIFSVTVAKVMGGNQPDGCGNPDYEKYVKWQFLHDRGILILSAHGMDDADRAGLRCELSEALKDEDCARLLRDTTEI